MAWLRAVTTALMMTAVLVVGSLGLVQATPPRPRPRTPSA